MRITKIRKGHEVYESWLVEPDGSDEVTALEFLMKALLETYCRREEAGSKDSESATHLSS
jgi:hypothetical protein